MEKPSLLIDKDAIVRERECRDEALPQREVMGAFEAPRVARDALAPQFEARGNGKGRIVPLRLLTCRASAWVHDMSPFVR